MRQIIGGRAVVLCWISQLAVAQVLPPLPVPTRPLEWGDVNFLSTSDTHGWLLGHQHNYSGDFGDFASFATHMRALAHSKGVDLLLVDAGDHHDGPGLVSASPKAAVRADEIFRMLDYDILTIGNHEMYQYRAARWIYDNKASWGGRYLTSNAYISVPDHKGRDRLEPIGDLYRKFQTVQGRNVTAFGVLFDFQAADPKLAVVSATTMVKQPWFVEAIAEAPDFFVLAGHMPARGETAEWKPVFDAIRSIHPFVPVYVFGGHTHVRDCVQYDDHSIGSSLPGPGDDPEKRLAVSRRYLDGNRVAYSYHSNHSHDFDTPLGQNITASLRNLASSLNISTPLGSAPDDYFLARYPFGHKNSVLTEWANNVLPTTLLDSKRKGPRVVIVNAGSLRADLLTCKQFQGTFDRNDELTVSPFENAFVYSRLPLGMIKRIKEEMDRAGASKLRPDTQKDLSSLNLAQRRAEIDRRVDEEYQRWMAEQWEEYLIQGGEARDPAQVSWDVGGRVKTMGYVTRDSCPGRGDDVTHFPVPFTPGQPDFLATPYPDLPEDRIVDAVVMDFTLDDFLIAVRTIEPDVQLTKADFKPYGDGAAVNNLWGEYARRHWQV
ncbi:hypothetical protein JCM24511_02742 [Saitozyma sp. JCM 24511]|nr:hypothetical protein JCM24511_02742 [Saitozyma sp. JCM 24511]